MEPAFFGDRKGIVFLKGYQLCFQNMVYETPVFWTFRMCLKWDAKQVTSYLCGAWWYAPNTYTSCREGLLGRVYVHVIKLQQWANEEGTLRQGYSSLCCVRLCVRRYACLCMCTCIYGDQQDCCSSGAISFVYWESLVFESLLLGLGASWWCWDGWPISLRESTCLCLHRTENANTCHHAWTFILVLGTEFMSSWLQGFLSNHGNWIMLKASMPHMQIKLGIR